MADFDSKAKISLEYQQYLKALDELIKANQRFGKSVGLTGQQVAGFEKRLQGARTQLTGEEAAQRSANKEKLAAVAATKAATSAGKEQESQLIRGRYALFDVAQAYAAVAAATLAAVSATAIFATKYETAFTEIERTTLSISGQVSGNINNLRQDFLTLAETIPLSFAELTKIGALGAQMGIAEKDLVSFTETVAQFSRISGVSAEQSALAFGRIGQLLGVPAQEYVNLGSAITAVAVSSEATDAQVISLTKELAAGASGAGFTAAAVVGLSSALASLGVAPERARGAFSTYFATLNKAVAGGGQALEDFAVVTGISADELERLVRNGEGEKVLEGFIQGLSRLDNVDTTTALERLNLAQLRVEDTFRRLGQNSGFVAGQFGLARQAFAEGTFQGDAYAIVLDDVASQFQLLLNSVAGFLATAGLPFLEFLRVSLPLVAGFFNALTEFVSTDFGVGVVKFVSVLLVLIGVLAATRAAAALTAASVFAIATASKILGGTGVIATLTGMTAALVGTNAAAVTLKTTLAFLGRIFAAVAVVGTVFDVVANDAKGLNSVLAFLAPLFGGIFDGAVSLADAFAEVNSTVLNWTYNVERSIPALTGLFDIVQSIALAAFNAANGFSDMFNSASRNRKSSGSGGDTSGNQGNVGIAPVLTDQNFDFAYFEGLALGAGNAALAFDDLGLSAGGAGQDLNDFGSDVAKAGEEVRTFVDYANDLSKVFSRAFDIRFKAQLSVDGIADTWETLTDRIRESRQEVNKLTADKKVTEYFLSVAESYGDDLRAGVLRGELVDINEDLAEAQEGASTELEGNTQAARDNRGVLTGLIGQYGGYISALAESGADQETLNAAVKQSEEEFMAQGRALGFSDDELRPYVQSFRDMGVAIGGVPRNVTVTANANPALQALAEYNAALNAARANAQRGVPTTSPRVSPIIDSPRLGRPTATEIGAQFANAFRGGFISRFNGFNLQTQLMPGGNLGNLTMRVFSEGGFTGRGGKYDAAGIVHKGEYVVPKSQVNQSTGMPYANALGGQMPASRGPSYAGGGMVTGMGMGAGGMMVELSPIDRKLLAAAGNVSLSIDGRVISGTVARNNTVDALRGSN